MCFILKMFNLTVCEISTNQVFISRITPAAMTPAPSTCSALKSYTISIDAVPGQINAFYASVHTCLRGICGGRGILISPYNVAVDGSLKMWPVSEAG